MTAQEIPGHLDQLWQEEVTASLLRPAQLDPSLWKEVGSLGILLRDVQFLQLLEASSQWPQRALEVTWTWCSQRQDPLPPEYLEGGACQRGFQLTHHLSLIFLLEAGDQEGQQEEGVEKRSLSCSVLSACFVTGSGLGSDFSVSLTFPLSLVISVNIVHTCCCFSPV